MLEQRPEPDVPSMKLPKRVDVPVDSTDCDDCDGSGVYCIDGEPQRCICSEPQGTDEEC